MRPLKPARCGWCIEGRHADCVVIVETGGRPRDGKKPVSLQIWRCQCWECDYCNDTKCLSCQRTGVSVVDNRCPDPDDCRRAQDRAGKKRKREEEKVL